MKDKNDFAFNWLIDNVVVVIVPVFTCLILSSIYKREFPNIDDILNNIILILISILCSLLSISHETTKQTKNTSAKNMFRVIFALALVIWSTYIVFLTGTIPRNILAIIICIILIFICSCLGVKTIKRNCDNENERILNMHKNCSTIRETMFRKDYDGCLESHTNRDSDLLCNPDNFDRVKVSINAFIKNRNREK